MNYYCSDFSSSRSQIVSQKVYVFVLTLARIRVPVFVIVAVFLNLEFGVKLSLEGEESLALITRAIMVVVEVFASGLK